MDNVKFIADTMLGTLAKWLRIMGFDTLYDKNFSDDDLFFKTFLENRVLLTRDKELSQRVGAGHCLYITETRLKRQLKQVIRKFDLHCGQKLLTRCVLCNAPIKEIQKESVKDRVPEYVYQETKKFYYCSSCDKIYWAGSHVQHIRQFLEEIKGDHYEQER